MHTFNFKITLVKLNFKNILKKEREHSVVKVNICRKFCNNIEIVFKTHLKWKIMFAQHFFEQLAWNQHIDLLIYKTNSTTIDQTAIKENHSWKSEES